MMDRESRAMSAQERDAVRLLAVGQTRHDVATALGTSESGLSRILADLFARYDVVNTTALVAKALVRKDIELTTAEFPPGIYTQEF